MANGMTVVSRPVGAALPGERWRLCNSVEGFAAASREALDHPPDTQPLTVFSEDEAADALAALYENPEASR
jgi:hypothetical protein